MEEHHNDFKLNIFHVFLQNVSPSKTEMIDIVKTLNGALELTQVMEKTIEFGTQPDVDGKFYQFLYETITYAHAFGKGSTFRPFLHTKQNRFCPSVTNTDLLVVLQFFERV